MLNFVFRPYLKLGRGWEQRNNKIAPAAAAEAVRAAALWQKPNTHSVYLCAHEIVMCHFFFFLKIGHFWPFLIFLGFVVGFGVFVGFVLLYARFLKFLPGISEETPGTKNMHLLETYFQSQYLFSDTQAGLSKCDRLKGKKATISSACCSCSIIVCVGRLAWWETGWWGFVGVLGICRKSSRRPLDIKIKCQLGGFWKDLKAFNYVVVE